MKKLIVEFIGTFFLVLSVCMAGGHALGALAIGGTLMVMVYAGGHISGGHYNPAVTLGVWLRGKCDTKDVVPYWVVQVVAAVVAVIIAGLMTGGNPFAAVGSPDKFQTLPVILAEFVGTFALVWVVLNSATAKGTAGNSFYGLAIGFTVVVCAIAFGGSGTTCGAFNPAVAVGVFLHGGASVTTMVIAIIADLVGGAVAALTFKAVNGAE